MRTVLTTIVLLSCTVVAAQEKKANEKSNNSAKAAAPTRPADGDDPFRTDPLKQGSELLEHQADVLSRATPPTAAQSRFKFKGADGVMTVSIFQPGIGFTLDQGVLIVEDQEGKIQATIGTAPGGVLLVQQGDTLIECASFVRLKTGGKDMLHVSVTGGASPLAALPAGPDQVTEARSVEPPGAPAEEETTAPAATVGVPPKVKIED